jgi:hypothetical protein
MPGPGTWQPGDILTADDLNDIGVWQTYTPVLTQTVARSATVNYAKYMQINKMCAVNVDMTCTTTGAAGVQISVSLPIAGVANTAGVGSAIFFDSSATDTFVLSTEANGSSVSFYNDASTSQPFGNTPSVTLGNNDVISFSLVYEVA